MQGQVNWVRMMGDSTERGSPSLSLSLSYSLSLSDSLSLSLSPLFVLLNFLFLCLVLSLSAGFNFNNISGFCLFFVLQIVEQGKNAKSYHYILANMVSLFVFLYSYIHLYILVLYLQKTFEGPTTLDQTKV